MRRAVLFLLLLVSLVSWSRGRGRIVCIDSSVFVAYCDESIEDCVSRQVKDNWCWSACVQMVMRYNDIWVSQSEIVSRVYGDSYDLTATGNDMATALDGWRGLKVKSHKQKSIGILIDELVNHSPVIIGNEEHAYLLTHIYYTKDYQGDIHPFKVILINPKTAREEIRDWSDFFPAINTIVSIRV